MKALYTLFKQKWQVQFNTYFFVLLFFAFSSFISFNYNFLPKYTNIFVLIYKRVVYFSSNGFNMVFLDAFCCILTAIFIIYFFELRLNILLNSPSIIPNAYQYIIENINTFILNLLSSIMERKKESQVLFSSIYALFILLLVTNVQGMVPYSFTLASHLIDTFFLALMFFSFIITTILIRNDWKYFLTIFMPAGSPFNLAFLLIPLEIISYFFRVLSLSVRLFANMMAGHILLKVILGFAWMMMFAGETLCIASILPILTLFILTLLEFGVAMIQAYIFTILICIYLKDAYFAH